MVTSIPEGIVSLPSGISETFLKLDILYQLLTFGNCRCTDPLLLWIFSTVLALW